ncbi:helix-turn-helix domain-containing protein [Lentilactobacillus kisonensis]|nr:helix-turn-helix transcriptional regulator [Lentilactobacillus kisonensis]
MSDINVGKIIQQKRKALGITQEKLAELSNLSVNYISKMEATG